MAGGVRIKQIGPNEYLLNIPLAFRPNQPSGASKVVTAFSWEQAEEEMEKFLKEKGRPDLMGLRGTARSEKYALVYFLYCAESQRIKMGSAVDPDYRASQQCAGWMYACEFIGWTFGGKPEESRLHLKFDALNVLTRAGISRRARRKRQGPQVGKEWFHYEEPLISFIEQNATKPNHQPLAVQAYYMMEANGNGNNGNHQIVEVNPQLMLFERGLDEVS